MVFYHHGTVEITADLLNGKGRATEVLRYADILTFPCLKAFAFDQRFERKDAHDLIYCIENLEGGVGAAQSAFSATLTGPHAQAIHEAFTPLPSTLRTPNPDMSFLTDGSIHRRRFPNPED